ncbi:MAG: nucleotide exchange factor GrpE [Pyrinomonadaceae bacterium]
MGVNKEESTPNRIPIRFADEEFAGAGASSNDKQDSSGEAGNSDSSGDELTPEEIGSQSSYEDETEMQRRIDRGAEQPDDAGRDRADERDNAGSPPSNELPHNRGNTDTADTTGQQADTAQQDAAPQSAGKAEAASTSAAAGPMLAELIAARAELKRLEAERTDLQDKLSRRQADFENYRKRTERERGENYNKIVGDVVGKLLPVLDNLRRALDAEAFVQASESKEFRHFLNGVELISKQLTAVLEELGLRPVEALGQPFDPHLHEAVATESTDDYEPDTVMQELARGYVLGEKLLRPAMVKVATKQG